MSADLLLRLDEWGTVKRLEYVPSLGREAAARIRELEADLDAARAERDKARREALEEAAKVCEAGLGGWPDSADYAAAIRALIEEPRT